MLLAPSVHLLPPQAGALGAPRTVQTGRDTQVLCPAPRSASHRGGRGAHWCSFPCGRPSSRPRVEIWTSSPSRAGQGDTELLEDGRGAAVSGAETTSQGLSLPSPQPRFAQRRGVQSAPQAWAWGRGGAAPPPRRPTSWIPEDLLTTRLPSLRPQTLSAQPSPYLIPRGRQWGPAGSRVRPGVCRGDQGHGCSPAPSSSLQRLPGLRGAGSTGVLVRLQSGAVKGGALRRRWTCLDEGWDSSPSLELGFSGPRGPMNYFSKENIFDSALWPSSGPSPSL